MICHGFKGFAHWAFFPYLAGAIAEHGMRAITFDFSGSGVGPDRENFTTLEEFATNTFTQELDDLAEVIAESRRRGWIDRQFGLFGHSRGGGVAILHASRDKDVRALATWSAISSTLRYTAEQRQEWRTRGYMDIENARTHQTMRMGTALLDEVEALSAGKLDVSAAAKRIKVPWLIVHGDADETVPVAEAELLAELAADVATPLDRRRRRARVCRDSSGEGSGASPRTRDPRHGGFLRRAHSSRARVTSLARLREHPEIARLAESIASHQPAEANVAGVRRAAVALILRLNPETAEPEMFFIQRAHYESDPWSGQIAFPGGREEAGRCLADRYRGPRNPRGNRRSTSAATAKFSGRWMTSAQ